MHDDFRSAVLILSLVAHGGCGRSARSEVDPARRVESAVTSEGRALTLELPGDASHPPSWLALPPGFAPVGTTISLERLESAPELAEAADLGTFVGAPHRIELRSPQGDAVAAFGHGHFALGASPDLAATLALEASEQDLVGILHGAGGGLRYTRLASAEAMPLAASSTLAVVPIRGAGLVQVAAVAAGELGGRLVQDGGGEQAADEAGDLTVSRDKAIVPCDDLPPDVGSEIALEVSASGQLEVSWGAASDGAVDPARLEYRLIQAAAASEIDSVSKALARTGTSIAMDWSAATLSFKVEADLTTEKPHAFAVLVRDPSGNLALYAPKSTEVVVAGGFIRDESGAQLPGYWQNGVWTALPVVAAGKDAYVRAQAFAGGRLYFAGNATDAGDVQVAGIWKDGSWSALAPLSTGSDTLVNAIAVDGDDVYAAGAATDADGVQVAGYWKNGAWTALPALDAGKDAVVYAIRIVDGVVHAGGYARSGSGIWQAGIWRDAVWSRLTPLSEAAHSLVGALVVDGASVHAGGYSRDAAGLYHPGYWRDGVWTELPVPVPGKDGVVSTMAVAGSGAVVAGGFVLDSANVRLPAYWLNGALVELTPPDVGWSSQVRALALLGGDVYAAGNAGTASGRQVAGYWRNRRFVELPAPKRATGATVNALTVIANLTELAAN